MLVVGSLTLTAQNVGLNLRSFMSAGGKSESLSRVDKFALRLIDNKEYAAILMKLKPNAKTDKLVSLNCIISSKAGNIYNVLVPLENIEKVIALQDIVEIDMARKVGVPNLKNATQDINADYVQQGLDLPQGYTGRNVIIGDVDWGIDYTHPVFYDTSMTDYRILAAWDQFRNGGTPPSGYSYGTLLEGKDALLAAGCDTNNIYDLGNHATHVGGIMGGAGAGTQYRGIAYNADLLFATWLIDESGALDAYSWMRDVAKATGKRLVINNSWGIYYFGQMDGTSMFDQFVSNLSEEDSVIFTSSAGNNGDVNFHIAAHFEQQDTLSSQFSFNFPTPYSEHYWGETISLTGDSVTGFASRIMLYGNAMDTLFISDWVSTYDESLIPISVFITPNGDSLIYGAVSASLDGGRPSQEWEVRLSNYNLSAYRTVLQIAAEEGTVHAWNVAALSTGVGNWGLPFSSLFPDFIVGDNHYGIGEPAIGNGMIAVAAHNSGRRNSSSAQSNIAGFSSRGPNLSGALKPEISAPGMAVISAYSSFSTDSYNPTTTVEFNGRTYPFVSASGTSMSCPMVSGTVALMLEANPTLTPSEVREILLQTARTDSYTGSVPNYTWGWGKTDAHAAVKEAINRVGLSKINNDDGVKLFPNPAGNIVIVESKDLIKSIKVFDVTGRELSIERQANAIDLSALDTGIYFFNICFDNYNLTKKVIKR